MQHLTVDQWSRRESFLHARDPRAKLVALLCFLVWLATVPAVTPEVACGYGGLLLAAALMARLPLAPLLQRTAIVMPFAGTFALLSWLSGDSARAASLLVKSSFSAFAVMLAVATTPMPALLAGAERLGAPTMVVTVVQFLYRYLFVLSEKARNMRLAAACRGGLRRKAAGGAITVLFGSSYERAEGIHRAMLSRGYTGRLVMHGTFRFGWMDGLLALVTVIVLTGGRLLWRL
ncbi:MAG: hypothetical protein JJE04_11400 [Acidobacteriia bacterium]|nr:hypothetical protein [Terriglobia bacterium]